MNILENRKLSISEAERLISERDDEIERLRSIAERLGENLISHIREMYPKAYEALGPSGKRSVKGTIANAIKAELDKPLHASVAQR